MADDVLAFVDSIEEPAGLVGWSGGAVVALVAAAKSSAITAVAAFEPGMMSLADEPEQAVIGDAMARAGELVEGGDLAAAARAFARWPFSEREIAAADGAGYFEAAGRHVPNLLSIFQQWMADFQRWLAGDGLAVDDPAVLGAISAPVRVLLGTETRPFFSASARHVIDHAPDAGLHKIPGAAHAAPLTHPEPLAAAVTEFFAPVQHHSAP